MITLDTNVLIRYLVRDDADQADAALRLLDTLTVEHPGYICREVAIEMVWVLDRTYRLPRDHIASVVEELARSEEIIVENREDVIIAADGYRRGLADFADFMILAAANRVGARQVYTFDRKFSRIGGTHLIEVSHEDSPCPTTNSKQPSP